MREGGLTGEAPPVPFDPARLLQRHFPAVRRSYGTADAARAARGFGAGLTSAMAGMDAHNLDGRQALPVFALALADGEFWQMAPETGIDWRRIVHAEECLTVHQPLPPEGVVVVTQNVAGIYDRGAGKGAVMEQQQCLHSEDGVPLATIDVTTLLRGNGGFGGQPWQGVRRALPEDRAPDLMLELLAPPDNAHAIYRLSGELAVAGAAAGKTMMRGIGCFGLAGRAVQQLVCGGDGGRLKRLAVRYVGPLYCGEVLLVELWYIAPGQALFRMAARGRSALVLDNCFVEFEV